MPVRATKRGAERTPLDGAVRRPDLRRVASPASPSRASCAARGARVLVLDRYEIGERQTSACAAPTEWLREPRPRGVDPPDLRRRCVVHTPRARRRAGRCRGRSRPSTTAQLCALLWEQCGRRRVRDREGRRPHRATSCTPTAATLRAPLIVDALGWRRVLGAGRQRPAARGARSRAGWRSTRAAAATTSSCGSTRATSRAGYGWSFPAGDEVRVGVGSFDPRDHVKEPTRAAGRGPRRRRRALPGQLDPAPAAPGDRGRRVLRRRLAPATACR